jgi:hypothetical protein
MSHLSETEQFNVKQPHYDYPNDKLIGNTFVPDMHDRSTYDSQIIQTILEQ